MCPATHYSDYDPFAWVYNKHWGNKFVPLAISILEELVLPRLPSRASILDLCCGTGQLSQTLIKRGYRVTGVDGSEGMLCFARENAPDAKFIAADARSFELPDAYHAVVSTFDSLNHVMTLEDLTSVFHHVYAALHEGGLFLFDLNMEEGYRTCWDDNFGIVENDHVCVVRTSYHPYERTARFDATILRLQEGWQRTDVTLMQKCYSEAEVRSALARVGFIEIQAYAYDDYGNLAELSTEVDRAFFLCQKLLTG